MGSVGTRRLSPRPILAAAAVAVAALATAGCGGGGDGTTARAEAVAQIEKGCERLSSAAIWLPEHLEKADMSVREGTAIVRGVEADNRERLEALDPPADLKAPVERLIDFRIDPQIKSRAEFLTKEEQLVGLYREIGAERCRKGVEASILSFKGMAVEDAYRRVGAPLPPHPPGW